MVSVEDEIFPVVQDEEEQSMRPLVVATAHALEQLRSTIESQAEDNAESPEDVLYYQGQADALMKVLADFTDICMISREELRYVGCCYKGIIAESRDFYALRASAERLGIA